MTTNTRAPVSWFAYALLFAAVVLFVGAFVGGGWPAFLFSVAALITAGISDAIHQHRHKVTTTMREG
jgi:uncharacterized membrane-anchored protein YitT (DUF2179 family)